MKKTKNIMVAVLALIVLIIPAFMSGCFGDKKGKLELFNSFKTEYYVGDDLDLTNGKLKYTDKESNVTYVDILESMVSDFNTTTVGSRTLLITYQDLTLEVDYTVSEEPVAPTLTLNNTFKTEYYVGEALDITGGVLKYTNNGQENLVNITAEMVFGFNSNTVGNKILSINYEGLIIEVEYTVSEPKKIANNIFYYAIQNNMLQYFMIDRSNSKLYVCGYSTAQYSEEYISQHFEKNKNSSNGSVQAITLTSENETRVENKYIITVVINEGTDYESTLIFTPGETEEQISITNITNSGTVTYNFDKYNEKVRMLEDEIYYCESGFFIYDRVNSFIYMSNNYNGGLANMRATYEAYKADETTNTMNKMYATESTVNGVTVLSYSDAGVSITFIPSEDCNTITVEVTVGTPMYILTRYIEE